jgi:hypothetical protein
MFFNDEIVTYPANGASDKMWRRHEFVGLRHDIFGGSFVALGLSKRNSGYERLIFGEKTTPTRKARVGSMIGPGGSRDHRDAHDAVEGAQGLA